MANNNDFLRDAEPMCALDPLLLIPRIEYVSDILSCVQAKEEAYTLVILDMKNFHLINDVYDYDTGDKVLQAFILLLRKRLPVGSISLRFRHGDEFLFFLPVQPELATQLFSTFDSYCAHYPFLSKPNGDDFLISFRFASLALDSANTDFIKLLQLAEAKLRAVKGQGSVRSF